MAKKKVPAWRVSLTAAENAKAVLPVLSRSYFAEGRDAAAGDLAEDDLHRFRLATKRFRYTLELFQPCYPAGLDQRLAQLRQIQQYLGEINDCRTAAQLIRGLRPARSKQPSAVFAFLERRAAERVTRFHEYWTKTFDAPGREQNWVDYLIRYAGRMTARRKH